MHKNNILQIKCFGISQEIKLSFLYINGFSEQLLNAVLRFSCVWLCHPMDDSPPGSSVHVDSPGRNTGMGWHALLRESSQPGTRPRSPALQVDSLPSELPGKYVNVYRFSTEENKRKKTSVILIPQSYIVSSDTTLYLENI